MGSLNTRLGEQPASFAGFTHAKAVRGESRPSHTLPAFLCVFVDAVDPHTSNVGNLMLRSLKIFDTNHREVVHDTSDLSHRPCAYFLLLAYSTDTFAHAHSAIEVP